MDFLFECAGQLVQQHSRQCQPDQQGLFSAPDRTYGRGGSGLCRFRHQLGNAHSTVEAHPRSFGFARACLRRQRNVTLLDDDSLAALRTLFNGPLRSLAGRTLYFYLDAHRNDDLPLAEELDFIFSACPNAVVMIDDFQVPDDPGCGYEDSA